MAEAGNKELLKKIDSSRLPRHIAIIMDGNGRWAQKRRLPRNLGHQAGIKTVRKIIEAAVEVKIPVVTFYAFSVDNWSRPPKEIKFLMKLLEKYISRDLEKMKRENIQFKIIGDITKLSLSTRKAINMAKEELSNNNGLILVLAINYGSRAEIIKAVQKITGLARKGKMEAKDVNEKSFSRLLETGNLPDPDLLIRTSGEKRLSNFLLWQLSYTELYFSDKLWPDFTRRDFLEAIIDFQTRSRRYGGL